MKKDDAYRQNNHQLFRPSQAARQREHIFFRDDGRGGGGGAYFSVIRMNKKEIKIVLIYKEIRKGSVAKS